jgi:hypothetical protein
MPYSLFGALMPFSARVRRQGRRWRGALAIENEPYRWHFSYGQPAFLDITLVHNSPCLRGNTFFA